MRDFPSGTSGQEPTCQCRMQKRCGWIPGLGKSPRGGHGNPLQYFCLENPMDRGAWHMVPRVTESEVTETTWHARMRTGSNGRFIFSFVRNLHTVLCASLVVKNPPANAGDMGSIHGSERSLGEGNVYPLQYSCPGNPTDRGARRTIVHRFAKESDTT